MKRRLGKLTVTMLLCAALLLSATAMAGGYTIDEALQLVGTEEGRANGGMLELTDDFSQFYIYHEEFFSSEGGKTIILWREAPEKEYTPSPTPIDADFAGKALGEPKVYLCAELMEQIPEDKRAQTFEEADNILMAEVIYDLSGRIWTSTEEFKTELPDRDALDGILSGEGAGEQSAEPEEESSAYVYHPLYECTVLTGLYSTETLGASFVDWMTYPYAEMRSNPEADDYWTEMLMLLTLLQNSAIEDGEARFNALLEALLSVDMEASALTEAEWDELIDLALGEDMEALGNYCWDKFWEMAPLLGELDPECAEMFDEAIAQQSLDGMFYIVNTRSYSSVDMEDDEIISSKSYLGQPDLEVLGRLLNEAVELMGYYDWDMAEVSEALAGN